MQLHSFLLTALMALTTSALPLNINLGAYSPALVVGDGAISFEEGEGVENLVEALQGAAVNEASGAVRQQAQAPPAQESASPDLQVAQAQVLTPAETPILSEPAFFPEPGTRPKSSEQFKQLDPRIQAAEVKNMKTKRDLAGFDRALRYAEAALTKGPKIELGTGAHGSGVGIIVDNNPADAVPAVGREEGGGGAAAERRNNGIVVE
ncbi:hypothetical protein V8F20_007331 [Naviculisporaceae sp. PSN 640]